MSGKNVVKTITTESRAAETVTDKANNYYLKEKTHTNLVNYLDFFFLVFYFKFAPFDEKYVFFSKEKGKEAG